MGKSEEDGKKLREMEQQMVCLQNNIKNNNFLWLNPYNIMVTIVINVILTMIVVVTTR